MGLQEVQEELKAKIAEAEAAEAKEFEAQVEEPKVEEKEEESNPEEVIEPSKEEPKSEDPVKTSSDYARERREAKAIKLSAELEIANARIAELTRVTAQQKTQDEIPDKSEDPQGWTEYQLKKTQEKLSTIENYTAQQVQKEQTRVLREEANREVVGYENESRQKYTDYDDVKNYYMNMLAASIKIVNPKITNDKLVQVVYDRLLLRASELLHEGHANPIDGIYHEAKTLGYRPSAKSEDNITEIKPDLAKVASNRARNAGTAGAAGESGRGELTPKVAAGMTNKEFAKLKPEEKRRIFAQLGG